MQLDIQGGNFNWNKIHNLEIGNFCKKSRNRSIFIFPCPHFDAYGFCISTPGSAQPPPNFFFKWMGMSSDTYFQVMNFIPVNVSTLYILKFYK
jgi:hypothetical protein